MKLADAPPPGWYPDPSGSSRLRWWEGTDWTDRYRSRPTGAELVARQHRRPTAAEISASKLPQGVALPEYRGSVREDADAIIAEVRKVARSEVERAADLFSARARAATRDIQPLISQYTNRLFRWVKFGVVIAVVLVIAWIVFQAIVQQSFFDWIGERIDNLSD